MLTGEASVFCLGGDYRSAGPTNAGRHEFARAFIDMAQAMARLGKPLKPQVIEFVPELPKTRNAKVMRRVIRAAYLGDALGDLSSLENPRAVDAIAAIRGARG